MPLLPSLPRRSRRGLPSVPPARTRVRRRRICCPGTPRHRIRVATDPGRYGSGATLPAFSSGCPAYRPDDHGCRTGQPGSLAKPLRGQPTARERHGPVAFRSSTSGVRRRRMEREIPARQRCSGRNEQCARPGVDPGHDRRDPDRAPCWLSQSVGRPPAMAGTMDTSSPALRVVAGPWRKRMSSSFT